jgi:hypothetical protein
MGRRSRTALDPDDEQSYDEHSFVIIQIQKQLFFLLNSNKIPE